MAWDYQLLCARPLLALRLGRLIKSSALQSNWVEHRSAGLCSSALRPCAQTLVPKWEKLFSIDLHMLNTQSVARRDSSTHVLLRCATVMSQLTWKRPLMSHDRPVFAYPCVARTYGAREERTLINSSHRLGLSSHYGRYLTPWLGFARVKLLGLWPLGGEVLAKRSPPPSATLRPFRDFQSNCCLRVDADLKVTPECSRAGPSVIGT